MPARGPALRGARADAAARGERVNAHRGEEEQEAEADEDLRRARGGLLPARFRRGFFPRGTPAATR
eukprot:5519790-Pyramimonas_sp.AAC.1